MRKRIKVPGLVTIMALTLITAILWVGFEVIRIVIAKPNPDVPAEVLKELNPTLDAAQLDKLQGRVYLSEEEIDKERKFISVKKEKEKINSRKGNLMVIK